MLIQKSTMIMLFLIDGFSDYMLKIIMTNVCAKWM